MKVDSQSPRHRRLLTAAALTAVPALLATACGGSSGGHVAQLGPATTVTRSSTSAEAAAPPQGQSGAVAFARCMRSHGLTKFPDPDRSGTIPKRSVEQLGVSGSRFQSAQSACNHLLPNGGRGPSAARVQQVKAQGLQFARCVRANGVPNFPDPGSDGRIPDPATVGIDQGSPKFEAANRACGKYRPPYMPSNAAYNAYARTHG